MANVNAPFGLRPVRHVRGGEIRANEYRIAGAASGNIFRGDPVKSTGTTNQIVVAAAGNTMAGIFDGCQWIDVDGSVHYSHYWPTGQVVQSGSIVRAWVWDDPGILFEAQMAGAFAVTDIGDNSDLVIGAGNTLTGMSTTSIDSVLDDEGVKIVNVVEDGVNAVGTYARVHVLLVEHEGRGAGLVAGV